MSNTAAQIEIRDKNQSDQTFLPVSAGIKYTSDRWQGASVAGDGSIAVSDFGETVRKFSIECPVDVFADWQAVVDFIEASDVNYQQNWFFLSFPEYQSDQWMARGITTTTISGRDFIKVRLQKPRLDEQSAAVFNKVFSLPLRLEETA